MNSQTVLVVPTWVSSITYFLERNWIAIVGILILALLSCGVTEFAKHKWSVNYETEKAKAIIRWVLVATSAGFTALGTAIYFMQTNQLELSKLPYIGSNELQVLGVAWGLYNFWLNKKFASIRDKLASWSNAKINTAVATNLVHPTGNPVPPPTELKI